METQYRPIDVKKDKKQEGDEFFSRKKWIKLTPFSVKDADFVKSYSYRRQVRLDMEQGKYRLLEQTDEDHSRNDIEVFDPVRNQWEPNHGKFIIGFTYRVPVEVEKKPVTGATVMGSHMGFLPDNKKPEVINLDTKLNDCLHGMQTMLNNLFPTPAPAQCTCSVKRTEVPGMLLLYPKRECPVKSHSENSQLQGIKRDVGLVSEGLTRVFVFPNFDECIYTDKGTTSTSAAHVYKYIKERYEEFLKSS